MKKLSTIEKTLVAVSVLLFILTFVPRFIDIEKFLPYYSIDENEVVEFAVGYLGGNFEPYWYKYGPLCSYILAFVYKIQSFFYDGTYEEFVQQVFFEGEGFYYTARFLNSILSIFLTVITFLIGRKYFTNRIALLALALASFPFFDLMVRFTVRIDTLLAVFAALSVFFSLKFYKTGKTVDYIFTGMAVGLGLASKPIPGLLIFPTVAIAHFLLHKQKLEDQKRKVDLILVLVNFLKDKNIYIFLLAAFVFNFIGNPYSILRFDTYMDEQLLAISSEGGRNFVKGYDITRFFKTSGYVFVFVACIAFIHSVVNHRTRKHIILMSYPVIYWLAFAKGASRDYFYIPVLPMLIIIISQMIDDVIEKLKDKKALSIAVPLIILGIIIFEPMQNLLEKSAKLNSKDNYKELHGEFQANDWILENIPKNSKIMIYGYYTSLPRLIDVNPQEQMAYGEYFMYNRIKNEYLKEQFSKAHSAVLKSDKPTYDLIGRLNFKYQNRNVNWNLRYGVRKNEIGLFQQVLPQVGCDYLIAHNHKRKSKTFNLLDSPYFRQKVHKQFLKKDYPFGNEITIYKLK